MKEVKVPIRAINADQNPTSVEVNRRYAPQFDVVIVKGSRALPDAGTTSTVQRIVGEHHSTGQQESLSRFRTNFRRRLSRSPPSRRDGWFRDYALVSRLPGGGPHSLVAWPVTSESGES